MARVHREHRVILQMVEKLPTGDIDDWEEWVNDREIVTIDLKRLNEDLFAVLMDKTESEPGNRIEAFVKIFKWFMGTSGMCHRTRPGKLCRQSHRNRKVKSPMRWRNGLKAFG